MQPRSLEMPGRSADEILADQVSRRTPGLAPLDLPLDRPRPAIASGRRGAVSGLVPAAVAAAAERLAREQGMEAAMVSLAAFLALLGHVAGQSDVTVGLPAGSDLLPVGVSLAGDPSFRDLLRQVGEAARETGSQAGLPGGAPEGVASGERLLRAAFVPAAGSGPDAVAAGLDLVLALRHAPSGSDWTGLFDYDAELFDPPTVTRLLAAWNRVLMAAAADSDRRLSDLPWLSAAERHQIVVEWNDTAVEDAGSVCLHHLIEDCGRRSPDGVAWRKDSESLTWGELDRLANRLAHRLRRLGVGPEDLVGVFLQRSLPLVVTLVGIHKAGGAYVPLDPDYPAERLAFMLADSGAKVLVTQSELLPLLTRNDLTTVSLDPRCEVLAQEPDDPPAVRVTPENLAYLIYTSGSTGRPKGVAIRHLSGIALVRWAAATFSPAEAAGVLWSTSVCFDVSVFELFLPAVWATTGILVRHLLRLSGLPDAGRVTLVSTVPSTLAELLRLDSLPPSVQTVTLVGEPLPARLAEDLYRLPTIQRVWNVYGPTEDTVYSTFSLVPREVPGPPAIGRPIVGGRVHLLDPELRLVPLGSCGEIYLGGQGLARGYLGRLDLTAERFVPDPFGAEPGGRLYRTGDLGSYRPDGEIEYLGRVDQQVKVRGMRIEPGEIEAVLARYPGVAEAAVVVQARRTGPQLVAFYAPREGQNVSMTRLRLFLQSELPSYMVPARILPLESLPVTPNGKTDRKYLAALPVEEAGAEAEMVAPRTRMELELRQVWEEVLQVTPVSVTDNFFALGGNSLLAICLLVCVRERFGRDLPVPVLLQAPTIEQLARILEEDAPRPGHPCLVSLHPGGCKAPLYLIHDGAGGNIFRLVALARVLGEMDPERPVWGLQAKGLMGEGGPPLETVEEMAEHYIEAIRSQQPAGPYHLGGYVMSGLIAYEMALRLHDRGEQVGLVAMIDAPPRPASRLPAVDLRHPDPPARPGPDDSVNPQGSGRADARRGARPSRGGGRPPAEDAPGLLVPGRPPASAAHGRHHRGEPPVPDEPAPTRER